MYLGAILWTIIYDSIYAFQDREFDKRLNLKSTAIEMENNPKLYLSILSAATVALWATAGVNAGFGSAYFAGLSMVAGHFAW
jgi:4-hydroxybenzoate polyprenyltransferase